MANPSAEDMAARLLSEGFRHAGPSVENLSDPITDTPMVVTLDQLRPYELDPRITRNPLYDDIKTSIRERGLDAPPPITRRPGAGHYIIRNGGNTRLAILRDLWAETRDERFYRIACLFRPWPQRGEILSLTGHLAENELHGGLTFIERALGVAKARELYEEETGRTLTQSDLARRLRTDGYPVPQPHISRMQEAIQYLLPAIPNVLYAGLGRHQVEQLTSLRRSASRCWDSRQTSPTGTTDFPTLFQDVLSAFDVDPGQFSAQRVQDELVGQMADLLGENYDTLALEIVDSDRRWQALTTETTAPPQPPSQILSPSTPAVSHPPVLPPRIPASARDVTPTADSLPTEGDDDLPLGDLPATRRDDYVVSPVRSSDRLDTIQRLVAEHTGETHADFESTVLQAIPVRAGGLYPISDVWHIEPDLDTPEQLRSHIAQFAREIAHEAGLDDESVSPDDAGLGFVCRYTPVAAGEQSGPTAARAARSLLHALSGTAPASTSPEMVYGDLRFLLIGTAMQDHESRRLSDAGLVKLFRLIRLARRLTDLERTPVSGAAAMPDR
ncbi:ParB family protein [Acidomonas methanolica]|uniref:ParB/Sulfiredoxin domain-containing protein n=1 Tax=Acidomonas methanolica NBRC 104435 TaxID=1231351 RepID=A0A023D6B1_ACIMT|nr:ParB family protein [Acidomonas methanolica]MBU2655105.1 ParB family protein [Acidomonas methanolica]TCS29513.1 ParB family protein of integrating conjugative element (PFGI_1 class) [Acidomonas methanolica]GAJ29356.1 hypothetical protein Amme_059_075 [Acidomonas methanolica NBRC 104435]GBQ48359.1 hypothetical protein AA0498_0738 [Acidomonas methanolica]GEK99119.1 hypothetical protein AME01nite_16180 [Acidomonas methanolica NBRC 104435]